MTTSAPTESAPTPPPGFWEQDEVRHALAEQDFGLVIRAYRKACGISQLAMANLLGVSGQSDISRIERGRSANDLSRLTCWAQIIGAPQRVLWFQLPGHAAEASSPSSSLPTVSDVAAHDDQGDDVQRRDVFKLAAGTAAGAALASMAPWQRLTETLERGYAPDPTAITLIEDRTVELFRMEEFAASSTILDALNNHSTAVRNLLGSTHQEQSRRRLLSSAGETEALAGWLQYDLSQPRQARAHYNRALELAQEAGDGPLNACVLNYISYLLSSQDRPDEAAGVLADADQYVRGSAATTHAWISSRHAEEAARLGQHSIAERSLERAFTAYDYARPHYERAWTSFLVPSRLGSLAVSTYGRLHHPETDQLANSLLGSLPPTNEKLRAIVLADLALSAARNNDLDRAGQLADEAMPMALSTEGSMAQDRLWELTENLPVGGRQGTAEHVRSRITSTLLGNSAQA